MTVTEKQITGITVTGALDTITLGDTQQLTATASYTDNTTRDVTSVTGDPDLTINWSITSGTAVSVDNAVTRGLLTSVIEGGSTIGAQLDSVKFGSFSNFFNIAVQSQCNTGIRYSYYCWYFGAYGQSCNQVCGAVVGRNYHAATETFVGSSGAPNECGAVLNKLDSNLLANLEAPNAIGAPSDGLGCGLADILGDETTARYASPATVAGSSNISFRRACACDR